MIIDFCDTQWSGYCKDEQKIISSNLSLHYPEHDFKHFFELIKSYINLHIFIDKNVMEFIANDH